jgi:hypothetical protein
MSRGSESSLTTPVFMCLQVVHWTTRGSECPGAVTIGRYTRPSSCPTTLFHSLPHPSPEHPNMWLKEERNTIQRIRQAILRFLTAQSQCQPHRVAVSASSTRYGHRQDWLHSNKLYLKLANPHVSFYELSNSGTALINLFQQELLRTSYASST